MEPSANSSSRPARARKPGTSSAPSSSVLLIAAVAWFTIPWIAPGTGSRALAAGGWWLVLTLAFEFLAGHYLFGDSWDKLLADYSIARGRIWLLVPLVTLVAPLWAQTFRSR